MIIASRLGVADILVISGVLTGNELRSLMEAASAEEVAIKVIPAYDDLLSTSYTPQIRDVDINDLLRREPVQLNSDAISSLVAGRVVMVTGAGGSIGSEICRQVLKFRPKTLLLVERAENSLFLVEQEFAPCAPTRRSSRASPTSPIGPGCSKCSTPIARRSCFTRRPTSTCR